MRIPFILRLILIIQLQHLLIIIQPQQIDHLLRILVALNLLLNLLIQLLLPLKYFSLLLKRQATLVVASHASSILTSLTHFVLRLVLIAHLALPELLLLGLLAVVLLSQLGSSAIVA